MSSQLENLRGSVDLSQETRQAFSRDASIFEVQPEGVVAPADTEDLLQLIRQVESRRKQGESISLAARTGGTCMSGGSLTSSYVVDMRPGFGWVGETDVKERCIRVGGGAMHIDVEAATHPEGLYFAPYTSSRDICGIGGMIGNNASGEKSVKHGPTSNNIDRLTVALSNGELCEFGPLTIAQVEEKKQQYTLEGHIYREMTRLLDENHDLIQRSFPKVKKNAAGYALHQLWNKDRTILNLARIFIGSQGTLGLVTEAELKLTPFAPASRMVVVPIADLAHLSSTVTTMLASDPEVCETFDHYTYDLAKIYHPKEAGLASIADGQRIVVFAIYTGETQEEADQKAQAAQAALEEIGRQVAWIDDPDTLESFLLIRRKSFKLLLENPTDDARAMAFLEDTIVPLDHYGEFLAALEAILSEYKDYKMEYTYAGHIGDGSIRLVPLVNMEKEGATDMILEVARRVYDLVFAFGGSMSVDHNDGLIRTMFLERMYGSPINQLFKEVKQIFDPYCVFNPGKKVDGDRQYALEHMIRKNK